MLGLSTIQNCGTNMKHFYQVMNLATLNKSFKAFKHLSDHADCFIGLIQSYDVKHGFVSQKYAIKSS